MAGFGILNFGSASFSGSVTDLTVTGSTTYTPSATQTLNAGDSIDPNAPTLLVEGNGMAVTLTSVPTIAAGSNGEEITIIGVHDTNTVELQDSGTLVGSNLELSGGFPFTLGLGDTMTLRYSTNVGKWVEVTRSCN